MTNAETLPFLRWAAARRACDTLRGEFIKDARERLRLFDAGCLTEQQLRLGLVGMDGGHDVWGYEMWVEQGKLERQWRREGRR